MPSPIHSVCRCGHIDDEHQTLLANKVLVGGQRVCYGTQASDTKDCQCEGWIPILRTRSIDLYTSLGLHDAVAEQRRRKTWYEWVRDEYAES